MRVRSVVVASLVLFTLALPAAAATVPAAPTPLSPSGTITQNPPTFSWTESVGATSYHLIVQNTTGVYMDYVFGTTLCSGGTCTEGFATIFEGGPLQAGTSYAWFVNASNDAGTSAWSVGTMITYAPTGPPPPTAPTAPTLVSPFDGANVPPQPAYVWNASAGATSYYLLVQNMDGATVSLSVDPAAAGCGGSTGQCTYVPPGSLTPGKSYSWFVNASNAAGTSAWSTGHMFSVIPGTPPTLTSPIGTIATTTPTYAWMSDIPGPYYLLVQNLAGAVVSQPVSPACSVSVSTYLCSITPSTALNVGATYSWFVWNTAGWSAGRTLSVVAPGPAPTVAPSTPTPRSPFGVGLPASLAYVWAVAAGATEYDLLIQNTVGVAVLATVQAASVCGVGSSDCQLNATYPLTPGVPYNWFVRARNALGQSDWSSAMAITIATGPPPAAPTLLAPQGSVGRNPTFFWNAVPGPLHYSLLVQNTAGVWGSMDVDPVAAGCGSGTGTCSITASFALPSANAFNWFVKVWTTAGESPWGGPFAISTP